MADAAAGDRGGRDANQGRVVGIEPKATGPPLGVAVEDRVKGSAPMEDDAPSRASLTVEAIDLKDNGRVDGGREFRTGVRAKHDLVAVQHIVDGEDLGPPLDHDTEPADLLRVEKVQALVSTDDVDPSVQIPQHHGDFLSARTRAGLAQHNGRDRRMEES